MSQGLHLKSHKRCSAGIRTWLSADQSSSSTLTESIIFYFSTLPYTQRHCHVDSSTWLALWLSLLSTCSWCVVSALAPLSCGSRRIIQVDAAHWWGLRRDPPHMIVKHIGCTAIHNQVLYKCILHSFIHSCYNRKGSCANCCYKLRSTQYRRTSLYA